MQTLSRGLLPLLALVPLTGCCAISQSLSALFCGPTEEEWVDKAFLTPELALKTFLEAIARDKPREIYRTLSYQFTKRENVGEFEFHVVWERYKDEMTGIHLANRAKWSAPTRISDTRVSYLLTLETFSQDVFVANIIVAGITAVLGGILGAFIALGFKAWK